jgi:ELWxxDGT repeat protein
MPLVTACRELTQDATGRELYVTDGATYTRLLADIHPGSTNGQVHGSHPRDFEPLGDGRLLFSANAPGKRIMGRRRHSGEHLPVPRY